MQGDLYTASKEGFTNLLDGEETKELTQTDNTIDLSKE